MISDYWHQPSDVWYQPSDYWCQQSDYWHQPSDYWYRQSDYWYQQNNKTIMVAQGYKQTEVGVIPDDWEVKTLGEIGNCFIGLTYSPIDVRESGTLVLRSSNIQNNLLRFDDNVFVDCLIPEKLINQEKDILICVRNGSRNLIGKCALIEGSAVGQTFGAFMSVYRSSFNSYIIHLFRSLIIKKQIDEHLGATINQITNKSLNSFQIPIPPTLSEQTAIATALSDTDSLISSLEGLIAKKRNIKQGAMTTLLSPKEGWEVKSIFQLADNKKELFDDGDWIEAEHITDDGIRLIQTGNIGIGKYVEKGIKKYIYETSFYKLKCKPLIEGDLLICRLADPAGRACVLPDLKETKVITSVDITIFRPRKEVVNRVFLVNYFSTSKWFQQVIEKVGGTTHKRISRGSLAKIKISIPDLEEQTRIATILSDMDNEIVALETKLEKYKQIKQGMMTNLLTGKIRLV